MNKPRKKSDKRCVKTKRSIRLALTEVLKSKDLSEVTVKELCDEALISRNTFYAHYKSVEGLLDEIETEIYQQILELVAEVDAEKFQFDPYPILNELTKLIYTDFELYRHLMDSRRTNNILGKLKPLSKEHLLDHVLDFMSLSEDTLAVLSEFYAAGINAAYAYWFNSDRQQSLEEVTKMISLIVSDGMIGMLDFNQKNS